jgi:hypothetical protein
MTNAEFAVVLTMRREGGHAYPNHMGEGLGAYSNLDKMEWEEGRIIELSRNPGEGSGKV